MAAGQASARIWTIVAARTGSTRLPGKSLELLDWVVDRVRWVGYPFILAIPHRDNRLAQLCIERGWSYVEGPEDDVLSRYVQAAHTVNADHIIRVTADCPFLDVEAARWTVDLHLETGADFTHYVAEGRGVEVFTRDALERSHRDAVTDWEREHIDEHILANPQKFRIVTAKFSVDTAEDLELARRRMNGGSDYCRAERIRLGL